MPPHQIGDRHKASTSVWGMGGGGWVLIPGYSVTWSSSGCHAMLCQTPGVLGSVLGMVGPVSVYPVLQPVRYFGEIIMFLTIISREQVAQQVPE